MDNAPYDIHKIVGDWCFKLGDLGSEIRRAFLQGQEMLRANPNADLIDLSLGNPDLEPPNEVAVALKKLVEEKTPGTHRYMDNAGLLDTRKFIAAELTKSEGVSISSESVFMTCGAAGALRIVLRTLLSPGEEVVILAPYFVEYLPYTVDMGNVPVVIPSLPDHTPDLKVLESKLSSKTKVLMLNSPNNPAGVVYSEQTLKSIVDILKKHHQKTGTLVHIISDEPYARLVFSGVELPKLMKLYDATWLVRSHSKDLGLAGERIGYVAWGPKLSHQQTLGMMRNSARAIGFPNAPALMQRLLPHVFHSLVNVDEYEQRAKRFVSILREGGFEVVEPKGSFFVFPKSPIPDEKIFCEHLVNAGVLAVPGCGFGVPGYFRVSLTQSLGRIEQAANRIVNVKKSLA